MATKNAEFKVAPRYNNESLPIHWQVDATRKSLDRLFRHLDVVTNIKPYFDEALARLNLDDDRFATGLVITDIGAGICWTSAILAKHPKVKRVYAVDPSINRLKHARFVAKHFGVSDKLKIQEGSFLEPNIPEKVDLVLLSGSLHHCRNEEIPGLFLNIRQLLKPGGEILITGEHYMGRIWVLKRLLRYFYRFRNRSTLGYSIGNLRAPGPFSGDHWRARKELEKMFKVNGFKARFFVHKGLASKNEFSFYRKLGWNCYYAILQPETQEPLKLTESQVKARNIFLEEIHEKNKYTTLTACPFCGSSKFIKVSENERKGLPIDVVVCKTCDGCFKSKMLDKAAIRFYYKHISYILRGKDTSNAAIEELFQKRVNTYGYNRYFFIRHFVKLNPHKDLIVELGASDGANLYPWFNNGFEVLGIELDPKMVSFGKGKGMNLIHQDFSDLRLQKKAKLVILSHVMEHVEDANRTLKTVREIMAPNGIVFIESPGIRVNGIIDKSKYFCVEHNYNFDQRNLCGLVKKHNFEIIYADEYTRVLCCLPHDNQRFRVNRRIGISPGFIPAVLLRTILKIVSFRNIRLADLLYPQIKDKFKRRVYAKLLRLYFGYYYLAIAGTGKKHERRQK